MTDSPASLLLVFLLIAINGFFAGAEVSLLSIRPSRLRQMVEDGTAGAQTALNLLSNPGRLLSVTQVGVTLTSLGLGWAGEDTIYQIFLRMFNPVTTPVTEKFMHGLALGLSFLIISYLHVVLGEVVPKNIGIDKADRLAVIVAPALLLFYKVSLPFVVVLERSSAAIMRAMKIKGGDVHGGGHSAEELKMIVSSSRGLGYVPEPLEDMIHHVLDLPNLYVREVMVARNDIISIRSDATLDDVLRTMIETQHSRLPVYEAGAEKVIGILHYKDLLPVWEERRKAITLGRPSRSWRILRLIRPHMVVPETKPIYQMLEEFRHGKSHMAMVVDEFGTIVGMVTVEDVLEEIVGRIEDEHDEKSFHRTEAQELELDGATRIRDLDNEYGIEVPSDEGFETLAGFILSRRGEIPRRGDTFDHEGRRYTVLEMERNRIARVRIEKLPEQPNGAAG